MRDGAEAVVCSVLWERSGRAGSGGEIPAGGALPKQAHPQGAGRNSQWWAWPSPPAHSHGVAVVLFFQFCQHPRETEGGPGVGNIPPAWLRLEGAPTAMHGLGWELQTGCVHGPGWLGTALLGLAGVAGQGLMGRGYLSTFPWLEELTFCDSKAQKMPVRTW